MKHKVNARVLILEDDPGCEVLLRGLVHSVDPSAEIESYGTAEAAILRLGESAADESGPYSLIIADIFLTGATTGIEVLELCEENYPNIPFIITSGLGADRYLKAVGPNRIVPPFLQKPFYPGECKQIIGSILYAGV
jgi:DNA-binding NtrC family response regulator